METPLLTWWSSSCLFTSSYPGPIAPCAFIRDSAIFSHTFILCKFCFSSKRYVSSNLLKHNINQQGQMTWIIKPNLPYNETFNVYRVKLNFTGFKNLCGLFSRFAHFTILKKSSLDNSLAQRRRENGNKKKEKNYASIKFFAVQIVQDSVNKTWMTFKVRDILNEMNSTYTEDRIVENEQSWLFERKFARGFNEKKSISIFKTKYLLSAWVTFSSSSLFLLSISSILPRKWSRSCSLKKSSFIIARDSVRISSTFFWESRTPSFRLWKRNEKSVSQQLYTSLL